MPEPHEMGGKRDWFLVVQLVGPGDLLEAARKLKRVEECHFRLGHECTRLGRTSLSKTLFSRRRLHKGATLRRPKPTSKSLSLSSYARQKALHITRRPRHLLTSAP